MKFLLALQYLTNKICIYEKKQIIKKLRIFNRIIIVLLRHFVSKKGFRLVIKQSNDTSQFPTKD